MKQIVIFKVFIITIFTSVFHSCEKNGSLQIEDRTPHLSCFSFLAEDNPAVIISDINGEIIGDSIVICWIRYIVENKELIPNIKYDGDTLYINGDIVSKESRRTIDFSKPTQILIKTKNEEKRYTIYLYAFTGLPVVWIETENRQEIVSKEDYVKASFRLVEDVVTRSAGDIIEDSVLIKGRGNSSWQMPKRAYRLKFDRKVSLIDEPSDKSWVLIPNYSDKTSLRNALGFYMGRQSMIEYTPRFHFVELMLNGRYHGLYQLCEKIKASENRVNVGKEGYVMEIDFRADSENDSRFFRVPHIENAINIKEPDVEYGDVSFNLIQSYINEVDSVLFCDNFKDSISGWQKYLDVNSFVDWYLINEISNNTDARQTSSIYLNYSIGGKLKMGPLWDFDIAFGNCSYRYSHEGFWIREGQWYSRLFEDPFFVEKVKERFDFFYEKKNLFQSYINDMSNYLRYSVQENENRWGTLYEYTWTNYDIWGSYQNEIQSLKIWIDRRFEWLKYQFDNM